MHDLEGAQNVFETDHHEMELTFANEAEYQGEYQGEFEYQGEYQGETGYETETAFNEVQEMELAAELLEVANEAELEQFLGSLIKKAGRAAGGFIKQTTGKSLGGLLKSAAGKLLPMAGSALGNMIVPGVGGMIGGKLASAAGGLFGLELEGLSPQDQEFEVARSFVRFAGAAAKQAAQAPSSVAPQQAARQAVVDAAKKFAPGFVRATGSQQSTQQSCNCQKGRGARYGRGSRSASYGPGARATRGIQQSGGAQDEASGQWVRQNGQVILLGI